MAGMSNDPDIRAALAELRAGFLEGLEERFTGMETALEALSAASDANAARDALATLRQVAHKMAGSAGTFGLDALGLGAEDLERTCMDLEEQPQPPAGHDVQRLARRIEILHGLAEAPAEAAPPPPPPLPDERDAGAKADILLIEDDPAQIRAYQGHMADTSYRMEVVDTGAKAQAVLANATPDAILLDLNLPDMDGLDILRGLSEQGRAGEVIVITTRSSVANAVEAMRLGAFDYVVKPFDAERLRVTLRNALDRRALSHRVAAYRELEREAYCDFIGSSLPMQAVYRTIDAAAGSKATVFVTGESGTGKELCAQAIHAKSARAGAPFIALNCGAIPHDLMESEIFGHVKGAFTGAVAERAGAARRADGGTLFLDEVCEMEPALQTKLLRFLQTGTFQKVGGSGEERVDVRIVCATNRDPLAEVAAGRFREDLFYRLHVIPIHMPPLRDRPDDVPVLARHFLGRFAGQEGKAFTTLSPDAEALLRGHAWPGNVRQLENLIHTVVVLHDGGYHETGIVRWLFTPDPSLTIRRDGSTEQVANARPVDALHSHQAREVVRRAQAMAY